MRDITKIRKSKKKKKGENEYYSPSQTGEKIRRELVRKRNRCMPLNEINELQSNSKVSITKQVTLLCRLA
jgi:hypothetical protein